MTDDLQLQQYLEWQQYQREEEHVSAMATQAAQSRHDDSTNSDDKED